MSLFMDWADARERTLRPTRTGNPVRLDRPTPEREEAPKAGEGGRERERERAEIPKADGGAGEADTDDMPRASVKEQVAKLWAEAKRMVRDPKTRHSTVRSPPGKGDGTYHIDVDWAGIQSTKPGVFLDDNAVNGCLRWMVWWLRAKGVKVAAFDSHVFTNSGDKGCITREYDLTVLCDKFFKDVEALYPGGLLDVNLILVPIHRGQHWTLGVVDFVDKTFALYDSLLRKIAGVPIDPGHCREFADYTGHFLTRYATRVKKAAPDFTKFTRKVNVGYFGEAMPRQTEVECGTMMLAAAMYRMNKWRFNFGDDPTNLRMLVAYTIGVGKNPWDKYNAFRSRATGPSEASQSPRKRPSGGDAEAATIISSFSSPAPSGGTKPKQIKLEPETTHTSTAFNFRFQWATNGSVKSPAASPAPIRPFSTSSGLGAWLNADIDTLPSAAGRRSWDAAV